MIKYSQYSETLFDEDWNMNIPQGWDKVALKRLCKVSSGSTPKGQPEFWNGEIKWVTPDDLGKNNSKTIFSTNRTITDEGYKSCGTELIPKGSVVLSTRAPIGHTALIEDDMCFNQGCKGLTPNQKVDSSFLYYLIVASKEKLQVLGNGTTFIELSRVAFASFKGIFPSLPEQTQIASFLDKKTAQIDKLINEKEKLLKLLAEKRTAIITQAVTKGLDPNVEMKDSGIDWLGEIPKDWNIKKIKYISTKVGDGLHGTPEYTENTEYYFINGNNLGNGKITITPQTKTISEEQYIANNKKLNSQTILLSINGTIGNVAFYRDETVMLGKSAAYIKFQDAINTDYLRWFLESSIFENYFELELTGTTIKNLSLESIKNTPVTFPTEKEQKEIVSFIEAKTKKMDDILSNINSSINQLKEYREALITAAVTGQIDVRKEVVNE